MQIQLKDVLFQPLYHQLEPSLNRQYSEKRIKRIKSYFLGLFFSIFFLYRLLYEPYQENCIYDLLHNLTDSLNDLINTSSIAYQIQAIIAQEAIELETTIIMVAFVWKSKNMRPAMFPACFYGLRALYLNIQKMPYPEGIISYAPVMPCFSVPYGITRDFFYSGHTGLMIYSYFLWGQLKYPKMQLLTKILTVLVIFNLIVTRVHYSIDIVAAAIFTLWMKTFLLQNVIYFDKFFSNFYYISKNIIRAISPSNE